MMTNKNYSHYLKSRHWREIAGNIKNKHNYECQICQNKIIDAVLDMLWDSTHCYWQIPELRRFVYTVIEGEGDPQRVAVHHLSYERVGHEHDDDLTCVCLPCHIILTENAEKYGLIGNRRGVPPDVGRIANPTDATHHIWRSITANPREPKYGLKESWDISSRHMAQILNKMTALDKIKNEKMKSFDWLLEKPRE